MVVGRLRGFSDEEGSHYRWSGRNRFRDIYHLIHHDSLGIPTTSIIPEEEFLLCSRDKSAISAVDPPQSHLTLQTWG